MSDMNPIERKGILVVHRRFVRIEMFLLLLIRMSCPTENTFPVQWPTAESEEPTSSTSAIIWIS